MFYHLGELDDALTYALGAETLFDLTEKSEYVQTLLGKRRPHVQAALVTRLHPYCNPPLHSRSPKS